jgi:hypothetical protein
LKVRTTATSPTIVRTKVQVPRRPPLAAAVVFFVGERVVDFILDDDVVPVVAEPLVAAFFDLTAIRIPSCG